MEFAATESKPACAGFFNPRRRISSLSARFLIASQSAQAGFVPIGAISIASANRQRHPVNYPTLTYGTARASQFNGNRLQDSVVLLVLHCLQGQESWFPRPILFLATRPV
jgi:hypothetical protein